MAKKNKEPRNPVEKDPDVKVVKTNCFECHAKCGVLAYVKDGRLVKVSGNPEDPRSGGVMCSKGQAAIQILYSPDRIDYCLKRTRPKGDPDPGWEKISHQEAMDTIYDRVVKYKEEFGARSIAVGQGTGRGMNQWNLRLGNTIGQNHLISVGHICMGPMLTSSLITIGGLPFMDSPDVENASCYVVWGANPLWTEAGFAAHRFYKFMQRGGKLIVVDPLFLNPLSHKADIWLPVRPGSDSAMIMAWIHVILKEKLYNEDFLKNWTNACHLIDVESGYSITETDLDPKGDSSNFIVWDTNTKSPRITNNKEVDPALFGSYEIQGKQVKTALQLLMDEAEDMTPEKAAEITWVESSDIREAARTYAKCSPGAAIESLQGLEESPGCVNSLRGVVILMLITGNMDAKGGNVLHPFWRDMVEPRLAGEISMESEMNKLAAYPLALYPASQNKAFWDAVMTEQPYPVKMLIQIAGDPLSYNERPSYVRQALEKLEFLVVRDYFMSDTAKLADIVMPASHWTERDYVADECCGRWYYAQQRAVDPLHDRVSDLTFARELGNRIDPEMWPWNTDEELLDFQLEPLKITWEELKEKFSHEITPEAYYKFSSGDPDWEINTISGKFELYSNLMKSLGFEPLPKYMEPPETPISTPDLVGEYPLVLMTGVRVPYFYHSSLHNIPWLRSMQRDPQFFINTRTAKETGINEGDWAWIETPHGKARGRAHLTEGIHPKVISAQHGWKMGCNELNIKDYPGEEVNINECISDTQFGRETYTPPMRGLLCRVVLHEIATEVGDDS